MLEEGLGGVAYRPECLGVVKVGSDGIKRGFLLYSLGKNIFSGRRL